MYTIKLKIADDIYNHIMFLLNSQDKEKLEIEEIESKTENGLDFSKYKIKSFKNIKDPVQWQQNIRNEWQ